MVSVAVYLFVECMYLVPLLYAHGETSYWPIDAAMPSPKRGELERYRVRVSGVPANHVKLPYWEIDLLSSLRRLPARKSAYIAVNASTGDGAFAAKLVLHEQRKTYVCQRLWRFASESIVITFTAMLRVEDSICSAIASRPNT